MVNILYLFIGDKSFRFVEEGLWNKSEIWESTNWSRRLFFSQKFSTAFCSYQSSNTAVGGSFCWSEDFKKKEVGVGFKAELIA